MTRAAGATTETRFAAYVRSTVGGLPRACWVLWGGILVNRVGFVVQPFLAYYLTGVRGLSVTATGLVISGCGLGMVCAQLVGGTLADRVGRRPTVVFSTVANAIVLLLLGSTGSPALLVLLTFLFGLTLDMYRPASTAMIADLVPPQDRARAYGVSFWAVNLGFSLAMILGGLLTRAGFTLLFWLDAVTSVLFGLLIWRAVPETRSRPDPGVRVAGAFRVISKDWLALTFVALIFVQALVYMQSFTTFPLTMRLNGLPASVYGVVIALNGILIIALQPVVGAWVARRDHSYGLAASAAVLGLGFGLNTIAQTAWQYALAVGVWTIGEILSAGTALAVITALAPGHLRGRYSGMFGLAYSVAWLVAPIGGSWLLSRGAPVLWLTCGAVCAAAAAGQLLLGPAVRRRS